MLTSTVYAVAAIAVTTAICIEVKKQVDMIAANAPNGHAR